MSPLSQTITSSSRLREITDPLTWASCFLAFMATSLELQEGWLLYDRQFRQHRAAGAPMPWADINPSLMAATVLGQAGDGSGLSCSLCLAADHTKDEYALGSGEKPKPGTSSVSSHRAPPLPSHSSHRPAPYTTAGDTICRCFNRGWCSRPSCWFNHVCLGCGKPGHGEAHCPDAKLSRPRSARPNDARSAGQSKPLLPTERA